jgi:hypothetical protein
MRKNMWIGFLQGYRIRVCAVYSQSLYKVCTNCTQI